MTTVQRRSIRIKNKELEYIRAITKIIVSGIIQHERTSDRSLKYALICSTFINLTNMFNIISKYRTTQSLYNYIKLNHITGQRLLLEMINYNYPNLQYDKFQRIFKKYIKRYKTHFTNISYNKLLIERLFYYKLDPIALIQIQFPEEIINLILEYYV